MGIELLLTTGPSDVVEHLMRFARHLVQGFVHGLDVVASISPHCSRWRRSVRTARIACSGRRQARRAPAPLCKNCRHPCVGPVRFAHAEHGPDTRGSLDRPASETREPTAARWIPGYGVDPARLPSVSQGTAAVGEVNEEKPRTGWASRYGYPHLLATDVDPRRMRPPYRQLRPGSRRSLGLLAPAMPRAGALRGTLTLVWWELCAAEACLDARVVFDRQSANREVRPKLTRTTLP
jgi:hypothetical protein